MKIYIGHSNDWDYEKELYEPILESKLAKEHEIIFPHLDNNNFNSEEIIRDSNLFIAEVSMPSLGLGIEIGRAEMIEKKILCIYKEGYKCPRSLEHVEVDIVQYSDKVDMINKIEHYINKIEEKKWMLLN